MYRKYSLLIVSIVATFLLVACGGPSQEITSGNVLLSESFNDANAWESLQVEGTVLEVSGGAYQVRTGDGGYIWGLNEAEHTDVIIEVTAVQNSSYENNAYGVMCRSDVSNNGDGYYFLVSGDGFYSIAKGEGDDVNALVDWTANPAINKGQASNSIKAVCHGSYLALHINDKFMAEIEDSGYTTGYAGFTAAAFSNEDEDEIGNIDVSFDDLTISDASAAE